MDYDTIVGQSWGFRAKWGAFTRKTKWTRSAGRWDSQEEAQKAAALFLDKMVKTGHAVRLEVILIDEINIQSVDGEFVKERD